MTERAEERYREALDLLFDEGADYQAQLGACDECRHESCERRRRHAADLRMAANTFRDCIPVPKAEWERMQRAQVDARIAGLREAREVLNQRVQEILAKNPHDANDYFETVALERQMARINKVADELERNPNA